MVKFPVDLYTIRPTVEVHLPLVVDSMIVQPELVMLKIGNNSCDIGASCYVQRSSKLRKTFTPRAVVEGSLQTGRKNSISRLIRILSSFMADKGLRPVTVMNYALQFNAFMDWADSSGHGACLTNDNATRIAYRAYMEAVGERHKRNEYETGAAVQIQGRTYRILQELTGLEDLNFGIRLIPDTTWGNVGTEPASEQQFAHVLSLNYALFTGLSDLILNNKPFPYKLDMPKSLGWEDSFLWLFPVNLWFRSSHWKKDVPEKSFSKMGLSYDYKKGRIYSVDEIQHKYSSSIPSKRRSVARDGIRRAKDFIDSANKNPRHRMRCIMAMHAQHAFLFLFLANTGANFSVARGIETDGNVDNIQVNQGYRVIKYRAQGKEVALTTPAAFIPHLRRFMELRQYLLNGRNFPYLFHKLGTRQDKAPAQIAPYTICTHYANLLRDIDPNLPTISSRVIRATVDDYYRRKYDSAITARLMGHTEKVGNRNYLAGSPINHAEDITGFLSEVSKKAKEQKILASESVIPKAKVLEDGGICACFGKPEPLAENVPVIPDCRKGCIFCTNRILIANENDVRKVASAAYVMEQIIQGPMSEAEFRPQIKKCDDDLARIAAINGCREMVARIKNDVYENGNLTPYFADKFQLFLDLGVL
jgi:hypothetical protein